MAVARRSTMERLSPYSWGPHTHPLWNERRERKKNNRVGCTTAAAGRAGAGDAEARGARRAPNETIENDTHVIVFVGGVQSQRDPILVPKIDLGFASQAPGMRQHMLRVRRRARPPGAPERSEGDRWLTPAARAPGGRPRGRTPRSSGSRSRRRCCTR